MWKEFQWKFFMKENALESLKNVHFQRAGSSLTVETIKVEKSKGREKQEALQELQIFIAEWLKVTEESLKSANQARNWIYWQKEGKEKRSKMIYKSGGKTGSKEGEKGQQQQSEAAQKSSWRKENGKESN